MKLYLTCSLWLSSVWVSGRLGAYWMDSAEIYGASQQQTETQGQKIGNEVRTLRKLRQKTLRQLSKEAGLSIGYLSQVEREKSSPSVKALHAISRALGVNITWFFGQTQRKEQEKYIKRSGNHQ